MGDRCRGDCCRRLYLPFATRAAIAASDSPDAKTIAEMVIPLEDQTRAPDGSPSLPKHGLYFTCKNLQPNGDCGIYETRPEMCRTYPDGYRCKSGDLCQWDEARALPVHPDMPSPTRWERRAAERAASKARGKPSELLLVWQEAERMVGAPKVSSPAKKRCWRFWIFGGCLLTAAPLNAEDGRVMQCIRCGTGFYP